MANVKLPPKIWVDLYAATGITVGTQIDAVNLTGNSIRLSDLATEPTGDDDHFPLEFRSGSARNKAGDLGAWAMCHAGGGVDVEETP